MTEHSKVIQKTSVGEGKNEKIRNIATRCLCRRDGHDRRVHVIVESESES
jgi:hypothetical protein